MSELPKGWATACINDLAYVNPKQVFDDHLPAGFVPMSHAPTNFRDKLRFDERNWGDIKKAYTNFKNGDVIFAKVTPCFENGKAAFVEGLPNGIGAGSSEFFVLRPCSEEVSAKYLLALVKSREFMREGASNMTGAVGLRRVPKQFIENYPVMVPPAAEQIRISQKLDELLAQVDTLKARIDAIPVLLKRFRRSVLMAAVSGGISSTASARSERLSDICLSITDGDHQAPPQSKVGVPFITISAINDGVIRLEKATRYVPASYFHELKESRKPQAGDILFSVTGSICIPAMVLNEEAFTFQRHIAILRPNTNLTLPRFLYFYLSSELIKKQGLDVATGTAQLTVPLKSLRNFDISLPSLEEQTEIVRRVEQLFAFADQLEAKVAAAKTRVDHLTQSILAKAFRGELVPQDPNDEPASVLLERIKAQRAAAPKAKRGRKSA
jgi:type I restriction enzyme S subunit